MEQNFFDLIAARESCRQYDPNQPVEKTKLQRCLEAARMAPSACNSQPWNFIAVTEAKMVQQMREAVDQKFVRTVPAFIVMVEEKATLNARIMEQVDSQYFAQIDIGIAAAHLCLAATAVGLSTCMIGWWFDAEKIRQLLGLEEGRVRLLIAVGYAETDQLREKQRKPFSQISSFIE